MLKYRYSGYYKLNTGDKNYFYWAFESRNDPANDPVVLWHTGGPGCSGMLALVVENGPCHLSEDGLSSFLNPYSWNNNATLIYIDQPTGTGFSYGTDYDHNETEVGNDMYDFLQQWLDAHDEMRDNDFYVFGESYGGHYVPAVTHRIWQGNQDSSNKKIQLKGLAVGNGLTDPEIQYAYYPDMIVSTNNHTAAVGTIEHGLMKLAVKPCVSQITKCNNGDESACTKAYTECNIALTSPYSASGRNPYDMRAKCEVKPLCYNFTKVDVFFNREDVRAALGVGDRKWSSCNMQVNQMFGGDWMKNYQTDLPDQLESGIKVLIYAGDQDYICNWLGNKAWTLAMPWSGHDAFNAAEDLPYRLDSNSLEVGKLRTAKGFSFLQLYSAGHMVPLDQPEAALDMFNGFVLGSKF